MRDRCTGKPVAERKPFLLRIDSDLYEALARWADAELRSLNGQIEFLLRRALVGAGRLPTSMSPPPAAPPPSGERHYTRIADDDWDAKED
jgi:hypothetical protein